METITSLDEIKLLGYFETIRCTFLTKLVFMIAFTNQKDGAPYFDHEKIDRSAIDSAKEIFEDPLFYKALRNGSSELHANYVEDLITSLLTSSWNVFEQITKDLTKTDYATSTDELSVCYQNGRFQFSSREKKDIELFYYMRNAIYHYNGAYYASKDVDHRYRGEDFVSLGHHGEKMILSIGLVHQIALDIERYAMKAWTNATNLRQKSRE